MRNHSRATADRRVASMAWRVAVFGCCVAVGLAGCGGSKKSAAPLAPAPGTSVSDAAGTLPASAQPSSTDNAGAQSPGGDVPATDFLGGGVGTADSAGARLCALFTTDEISNVVGAKVDDGHVGGPQNSLCMWAAGQNGPSALLQVATADDWSPPDLADGYRTLTGIGDEAYAAPGITGWDAGALAGDRVVIASVWDGSDSGDTSADLAIGLLKEALVRLG